MINLFYCTDTNFGDAMSPMVVAKLSGLEVRPSGMWNADMMAIGSVFYRGDFFIADTYHASMMRRLKAAAWDVRRITSRPVLVWGSGFLQYPPFRNPHFMRKFKVFALRGLHTREILESYGLMSPDVRVAYGDPGLLFAELFGIKANPRYDIGIIPHKFDVEQGWIPKLDEAFKKVGINARLINVTEDPMKVVSKIAECDKIISSSLHGLIVADSLGIPNIHLTISKLGHSQRNYELKFRDYYSAYGGSMPVIIGVEDLLNNVLQYLRPNGYSVPKGNIISEVKGALRNAFPVF